MVRHLLVCMLIVIQCYAPCDLVSLRRRKRQIAGVCYETIQEPCMREVSNINPLCAFISASFCTSHVSTNCTRIVHSCCNGFVLHQGACVRQSDMLKSSMSCTGQHYLTANRGSLVSPNYPRGYPPNQDCIWVIRGQPGRRIEVLIWEVNLEPPRSSCFACAPRCIGDQVSVIDLVSRVTRSYCGRQSNLPVFVSYTGTVYIRFVSNSMTSYTGFSLSYNNDGGVAVATTIQPTTTIATTTTTTTTEITTTTTSTTTTTIPTTNNDSRALRLSIFCFGQQIPSNCTTFCNQHCVGGTVVSSTCREPQKCRPGCTCPPERPIFKNMECLTRADCRAQFCGGGMRYTQCMPKCVRTCQNADTLPAVCQGTPDHCVAGCVCPDHLPISHDGLCIPRALCPRPRVETIGCGQQYMLHQVRIVGGETANQGSWPWATQVYKGIPGVFQCGGTLICGGWVLTAAHCFLTEQGYSLETNDVAIYRVRIGKHSRGTESDRPTVTQTPERIVVHSDYDITRNRNDIALIKLPVDIAMTNTIRPACIPNQYNFMSSIGGTTWGPSLGAQCYVVGWGSTRNRGPSNEFLKQAQLRVRHNSMCARIYLQYQSSSNLCVGGNGDDTCRGDSGGPLLCNHGGRWYVDGITSYGMRCGVVGEPGVYTRVTSFASWIRSVAGNDCGHPSTVWNVTRT